MDVDQKEGEEEEEEEEEAEEGSWNFEATCNEVATDPEEGSERRGNEGRKGKVGWNPADPSS